MITLLCVCLAIALCGLAFAPGLCGWGVHAYAYHEPTAEQDMGLSWDMVEMELSIDEAQPCPVRVWVPRCRGRARSAVYVVTPKVMTHYPKRGRRYPGEDTNYGLNGVLASGVPPN